MYVMKKFGTWTSPTGSTFEIQPIYVMKKFLPKSYPIACTWPL
jgi:hypothetical protein